MMKSLAGRALRLVPVLLLTSLTAAPSATEAPPPSPSEVIALLKEGNARYVSGTTQRPNQDAARRVLTANKGQTPYVTVLSCSDSREPPELLFDRGIGDLFIIRVAGNVVDHDEIATAEYGGGHLHTPLILVLGHTKCGAVTAAAKKAEVHGSLPHLLAHIQPACDRAKASGASDLIERAIQENVWQSIYDLYVGSEELRELAREGHLKIVGAIYDIQSGNIQWMGAHPQEKSLLAIPSPVVIRSANSGSSSREENHAPAKEAHGH